ncbi:hypothetical protein GMMP15_700001 [Candidatus Magnetomoraceae bacterium gMMP-15]
MGIRGGKSPNNSSEDRKMGASQKLNSNNLIGREQEIKFFNELLEKGKAGVWPVYGPGGIGKTYLLEHLQTVCKDEDIACMFLDWEMLRKDFPEKLNAVELWQNVILASGKKAKEAIDKDLKRFSILCACMDVEQTKQAVEYTKPFIKEISSLINKKTSSKIFSTIWILIECLFKLRSRAINKNPEEALLNELKRFLDKDYYLVWLLDNHDLARQTSIMTRIDRIDSNGELRWNNNPQPVDFSKYLDLFHSFMFLKPDIPWISVITGRAELSKFQKQHYRLISKKTRLNSFNTSEIGNFLKSEPEIQENLSSCSDKDNILNKTALSIFKLTRGNPLLVKQSGNLICQTLNNGSKEIRLDELWEKETETFRYAPDEGFDRYVAERLVERIKNNQRIKGRLWRLALPYQLFGSADDTELQDLLFPSNSEKTSNESTSEEKLPFEQLADVGILRKDDKDKRKPYHLHLITQLALLEASIEYDREKTLLHQELETFFKSKDFKEAEHFHRLCGKDRKLLRECGMEPEEYWDLTTGSITLSKEERDEFRFQKLPLKRILKEWIKRLSLERDTLGIQELCGDAVLFLRKKIREGNFDIHEINSTEKLAELIEEAPHISDFHFKMALIETEADKKYERFREITDNINPAHAHAWWERGALELRRENREDAGNSFVNALAYGVRGFYNYYAAGYSAWIEGDHERAESMLKLALEAEPEHLFLREDFASLLIFLGKLREAKEMLQNLPEIKGRELFLMAEACFREKDYDYLKKLLEECFSDEIICSWEMQRVKQRLENLEDELEECKEEVAGKEIQDEEKREDDNVFRDIDEDNYEAWFDLGVQLSDQGRKEEAEKAWNKALEIKPDLEEAWNNLGVLLKNQGRNDDAENAYNKSLEIKPDDH